MAKSWTNTTKCCATCANWGGPRKLVLNSYVETESPGTRGKCYAGVPGDAIPGPTAMKAYCPKYQKWAALK